MNSCAPTQFSLELFAYRVGNGDFTRTPCNPQNSIRFSQTKHNIPYHMLIYPSAFGTVCFVHSLGNACLHHIHDVGAEALEDRVVLVTRVGFVRDALPLDRVRQPQRAAGILHCGRILLLPPGTRLCLYVCLCARSHALSVGASGTSLSFALWFV